MMTLLLHSGHHQDPPLGRQPLLRHLLIPILVLDLIIAPTANAIHRELSAQELIRTFGVDRPEHVPDYQLLESLERERDAIGGMRRMRFRAWNASYLVELRPSTHRLLSPHLESVVREGNHSTRTRGLPTGVRHRDCHFQGTVPSHGNVRAAVSDCGGRLMGVIVHQDHFVVVQTLPERVRRDTHYLAYRRSAALLAEHFPSRQRREAPQKGGGMEMLSEEGGATEAKEHAAIEAQQLFCDVSTDNASLSVVVPELANYTLPSAADLNSLFIFPQLDPITLEIGLFLDSQLFEHFRREFTAEPEQHLTDFALALINNVHVLYQQPSLSPNLDIVIVHFELWKSQPAPLVTELHRNGQAQTLLDSFCRHQARINPGTDLTDPNHWDHAVLLTGYDIYHTTASVAGVAPVGRMCDELFACSLVEGLHLGRSFVLAHEMGHNMGMVHDGVQNQCGRSCCLMSAVNGAGKTTWSECSVREFNAFLLQLDESGKGNCLRDPAEPSAQQHDHLRDGRLPGQRFTADQQCSYFWGRDFQVEIPNGRSYEDICRILWCGNSGSTISTAHPALEGSWCGGQKWCHRGQCEAWQPDMGAYPGVVDGRWSDWTSAEQQCPVTQCQVTGSIALISQLRTCTAPAPNNGGRACDGASVRGIVCGGARSVCEGFTRQEFGDRLCSAILHDQLRPDKQLSGASFLHQSQPCKIWCHVRDSELIRNKGQFPNGSPCGNGQFCVGGVCLTMNCDGRATVQNPTDCPSDTDPLLSLATTAVRKQSSSNKWEQWSAWTGCSATCGDYGVQKRTRKCRALADADCVGKSIEIRACEPPLPKCEQALEQYSEWSVWSDCEGGSCPGNGTRRRQRQCTSKGGDACKTGLLAEEEPCQRTNCTDASIARGQQQHMVEQQRAQWGEWQPCSVSCGIGFQFRERMCGDRPCQGSGKQARTCNVQDCSGVLGVPVWSEWGLWSACSRTCGQGVQQRHRRCLNALCAGSGGAEAREQKRCVLGPCPQWASWSPWTKCASCSVFETRKRHRTCMVKVSAPDGRQEDTELGAEACTGAPIEFDTCERSCDDADAKLALHGVRTQSGEREKEETSAETRTTSAAAGSSSSSESDEGVDRRWGEWSEWSACSRSCGKGGTQTRTRTCRARLAFLCGDGRSREQRACTPQPPDCPASDEEGGTEETERKNASLQFPEWSDWSAWSACSCFSLTHYRRRFCRVRDPQLKGFCPGSIIEQSACVPPPETECASIAGSWSPWSAWSDCSQDCGTRGHRIRNRMCASPLPSNRGAYCVGFSFDQMPCDPPLAECRAKPIDGRWSEWSDWSQCSNPCLGGQRSRSRYCSNPRPSNGGRPCSGTDFELQACSEPSLCPALASNTSETAPLALPEWAPWSAWSNCSAECGFSVRSRRRICGVSPNEWPGLEVCEGRAQMTLLCDAPPCENNGTGAKNDGGGGGGKWSEWGQWSEDNCAWEACVALDDERREEEGNAAGAEEGSGQGEVEEEESSGEGNSSEEEHSTAPPLALALSRRTRSRTCSSTPGGSPPCFGPSVQHSPCPPRTEPCVHSTVSQMMAHIWATEAAVRRLIF